MTKIIIAKGETTFRQMEDGVENLIQINVSFDICNLIFVI